MPFMKDIRCGPAFVEMNINCFYNHLDERGLELIQTDTDPDKMKQREESLHLALEEAAQVYIDFAVFGIYRKPEIVLHKQFNPSDYETVWEAMFAVMEQYNEVFPNHFTLREIQ